MPERATPEQFSAWLDGMGWSDAEAARHLETDRATIFRWKREQGVPAYVWRLCKTLEATHGPAKARTTRARAASGTTHHGAQEVPETPDRAEATTTALVLAHLELGGLLTGSPSWADAYDARDALERVLDLHDPTWTGRYDSIVEAHVRRTLGDAGIARLKAGAARHFARARELQKFKQQRHLRGGE